MSGVVAAGERAALQRLALRLEYATIAWNAGEAVLTIGLGIAAGSLALIGFGTDSIIEMFASAVVVWHIRPGHEHDAPERTRLALRLVAVAFFVLAAVLGMVAVRDLVTGRRAEESLWGIAYLAVTACVMFGLAIWKRRLAGRLDSAPLRAYWRSNIMAGHSVDNLAPLAPLNFHANLVLDEVTLSWKCEHRK